MNSAPWSRIEVEVIVDDYLAMLVLQFAGTPYSKAAHRRALLPRLKSRTEQAIEFKHANISAVLLDAGFRYIDGYKPRANYQGLLAEVVINRLNARPQLLAVAAADADRPMAVPEVGDILGVLTAAPRWSAEPSLARQPGAPAPRLATNYLEREARNRSLGMSGELFVLNYERARLVHAGRGALAAKIEHTSRVRGDHAGFDILSFDDDGAERLIEVKTTRYGSHTPFFVTRNEVAVSQAEAARYRLYRLYAFGGAPRLYCLPGALGATCRLSAATFVARPQ